MKKNGRIEILRFVLSIFIIACHLGKDYLNGGKGFMHHISFFYNGKLCVEFFFILSGFLMAKGIYSNKDVSCEIGKDTLKFIWKKYKSLFVPHIIVVLLSVCYIFLVSENPLKAIICRLPSAFFLQEGGISQKSFIHVEWYICSMLIAMMIIYPFLRKFYDITARIIAPLLSVCLMGYLNRTFNGLPVSSDGVINAGNIRAIAVILLGVFAFEVYRIFEEKNVIARYPIMLAVGEALCYIVSVGYIVSNLSSKTEPFFAIIAALGIMLTFLRGSETRLENNKLTYFLGEISLPIYLCQNFTRTIVFNQLSFLRISQKMIIVIVSTVILGMLVNFISKRIYKLLNTIKELSYGNNRKFACKM